jgi:hypothetical protein
MGGEDGQPRLCRTVEVQARIAKKILIGHAARSNCRRACVRRHWLQVHDERLVFRAGDLSVNLVRRGSPPGYPNGKKTAPLVSACFRTNNCIVC